VALALLVARTAEANPCVAIDTTVDISQIESDGVVVCYDTCWRLDYATRKWTAVDKPAPKPETPVPAPKLAFASKVHVCTPDCHDITLPDVAAINKRDVSESADRSWLAVSGPSTFKKRPIYVFDAVTGKLLSTIQGWKTGMGDPASFQRVAFVGPALFTAISDSPVSTNGRLFDPRSGRRLAEIGGKRAELDESIALDLGGNLWAFGAFDGGELYVYDVVTGNQQRSILSGPKRGGYAALQLVGKTLVGVRGSAGGGVLLYDVGKKTATHHTVPVCK
jgi:hypothetical protein